MSSGLAQARAVRRFHDLPGPPRLPLVGNACRSTRRACTSSSRPGPRVRRRSQVHLGRRRFLVIADHEVIASVLRDRPDGFQRTERLGTIARELGFEPGLFFANGEAWRRQRPMVMAGFDPAHIKAFFPTLAEGHASGCARRWQRAAQRGDVDRPAGRPDALHRRRDRRPRLRRRHQHAGVGRRLIQQPPRQVLPGAVQAPARSGADYWRWFQPPADRALERSCDAVKAAVAGFIAAGARAAARPTRRCASHPRNLIEAMIVGRRRARQRHRPTDDVAGNVLTMLLAGEDTTANTLAWMIWLLHRHPEALQRARATRSRARRSATAACSTPEQLGALDYVEACAHETMRLKPVAPLMPAGAARHRRRRRRRCRAARS